MFPLIHSNKPNPCRFFQIWLNLEAKGKALPPAQVLHWAENIPIHSAGESSVRVWAGSYKGLVALPAPSNTYSSNPASKVCVLYIKCAPGEEVELEEAQGVNRTLYMMEGSLLLVGGEDLKKGYYAELNGGACKLVNAGDEVIELLYLAGTPIGITLVT